MQLLEHVEFCVKIDHTRLRLISQFVDKLLMRLYIGVKITGKKAVTSSG